MKHLLLSAFVGLALASATPALAECDVAKRVDWDARPLLVLKVEARAYGETCAQAEITIAIRHPSGDILWSDAAPAANLMTFAQVRTAKAMAVALGEWIGGERQFETSADLPAWKVGEAQPVLGEFPFYPHEGIDRATYEEMRGAKLPVFSYVQGMESLAVIVLREDGRMQKLGAQSFPG